MREHNCPWDSRTTNYAAEGGHTELLRWAREHGCPEAGEGDASEEEEAAEEEEEEEEEEEDEEVEDASPEAD